MKPIDIKHMTPQHVYWQSFKLLYRDLEECLRYVHPTNDHMAVFSLRFYELFLRASTEFESICKDILIASKLSTKNPKDYTIGDYFLLNDHFEKKPCQISVGFLFNDLKLVQPLDDWQAGHSLKWYREYNIVKHNRDSQFKLANLTNVLHSISALFVMIERLRLCPQGKLGTINLDGSTLLVRQNDEWPIILVKHYKK